MGKLKLADINKLFDEINKKQKFYFDKENDVYLEYYNKFSESKLNEVLVELDKTVNECEEKGLDDFKYDNEHVEYFQFLLIKHFTSLKSELDKKSYAIHKKTKKRMQDTGLYRIIVDHVFTGEEVNKALELYNEINNLGTNIQLELEKFTETLPELNGIKLLGDKVG